MYLKIILICKIHIKKQSNKTKRTQKRKFSKRVRKKKVNLKTVRRNERRVKENKQLQKTGEK